MSAFLEMQRNDNASGNLRGAMTVQAECRKTCFYAEAQPVMARAFCQKARAKVLLFLELTKFSLKKMSERSKNYT